jgi:hypothetical protein
MRSARRSPPKLSGRGWTIVEWFEDEGFSGGEAPDKRPGLTAAIDHAVALSELTSAVEQLVRASQRCFRTAVLPDHRFPISLACQSPAGGVVRPGPGTVKTFASKTSTTSHTGHRATFDLGDDGVHT